MHDKLVAALGADNAKRVVHADNLALEYQELRVPEMLPSYKQMMEAVHSLHRASFFERGDHAGENDGHGCRLVAAADR